MRQQGGYSLENPWRSEYIAIVASMVVLRLSVVCPARYEQKGAAMDVSVIDSSAPIRRKGPNCMFPSTLSCVSVNIRAMRVYAYSVSVRVVLPCGSFGALDVQPTHSVIMNNMYIVIARFIVGYSYL